MKSCVWITGFPRCGGASLCRALNILGWNSIHNPRHWDDLQGHNAAADILITAHWRELAKMFPKSRFILNTRDFEDWLKSLRRIPEFWCSPLAFDRYYQMAVYGTNDPTDRATLERVWRRHHHDVVATLPADRLLVMPQPFGWDVLTEFLGVGQPRVPFPWLNRRSEADARVNAPGLKQNLR